MVHSLDSLSRRVSQSVVCSDYLHDRPMHHMTCQQAKVVDAEIRKAHRIPPPRPPRTRREDEGEDEDEDEDELDEEDDVVVL